jgi:hypothetical protein
MLHRASITVRPYGDGYAMGVHVISPDGTHAVFIAIIAVDSLDQLPDSASALIDNITNVTRLYSQIDVPSVFKKAFGE